MTSLGKFSDQQLSDLISRAEEQMVNEMMEVQKIVDTGRITAVQGDYRMQEVLDACLATKREIKAEQFRRETNKILRNRILSAVGVMLMAGMIYFLFFMPATS